LVLSSLLRHYLGHARPEDGDTILADAFQHGEAGAVELLRLGLSMRINPRTVRTVEHFRTEWFRNRSPPKWYLDTRGRLLSLFRCLCVWATPNNAHTDPRLQVSRAAQRAVAGSGAARESRDTLKQRATAQAASIMRQTKDAQLVLWMDNHYLERFGTDPGADVLSQNVTAMAVLVVDRLTGSRSTRAVRWARYPGHPEIGDLVDALPGVLDDLARELPAFIRCAGAVAACNLSRKELRVPLDVQRGTRPRYRWLPYSLEEVQVGSNEDLITLLRDAVDLQGHSGCPLPLLVDENIHYRVARMLYGSPYKDWALSKELKNVPILYGVWHAYKHTLTVVYRAYFAVLAHLDCTGVPPTRGPVKSRRRVLYMEKMFASLYLNRADLLPLIARLLAAGAGPRPADQASSSRDAVPPANAGTVDEATSMRVAVRDLLEFYAPALVRLGFLVRQCTWCGGPQGTVKGDTACHILRVCLLIQVHLQDDRDARHEYTRTLAVALLLWQPWKSALPACAFVEESCEALLSRYAGACRRNRHVSGFADVWRLFVTLPQSSETAAETRGSVRRELVLLIRDRARALLMGPSGRPYPNMTSATAGQWQPQAPPAGLFFPGVPPSQLDRPAWLRLLQSVLGVLSVGSNPTAGVAAGLDAFADDAPRQLKADRRHSHEGIRHWYEARQARIRVANAMQRPVRPPPKPRAKPAAPPADAPAPAGPPTDEEGSDEEVVPSHAGSQASSYKTDDGGPPVSENYHSAGETDGLGSVGDVEEGASAPEEWSDDSDRGV
jgi:hypothetical protein